MIFVSLKDLVNIASVLGDTGISRLTTFKLHLQVSNACANILSGSQGYYQKLVGWVKY